MDLRHFLKWEDEFDHFSDMNNGGEPFGSGIFDRGRHLHVVSGKILHIFAYYRWKIVVSQ